ncbi:MAG: Nif3-like dinuclear metal center hexameric protein [Bacteroidaceae bacterium]|nr:Nif3-like dinuclear metal center hexameric protein [Bacteroidaceae bacterium]
MTIMKLKELIGALEEYAPLALQDGYDNAGLQIGLAEDADITGALLCLEVTEDIVNEAVLRGCNFIVSHHPLMFQPVKSITNNDFIGRTILKAVKNNIAIYAAHTNLDVVQGGVNFRIAEKLGLRNIEFLLPKEDRVINGKTITSGEGVIATLPTPMSKREFMENVKEVFRLRSLRVNNAEKRKISKVAICGGSGAFLIPKAVEKGVDAFITGEIGYHRFFGYDDNIILMEVGHHESEQYTMELLRDIVTRFAPTLYVCKAETNTNPINYL